MTFQQSTIVKHLENRFNEPVRHAHGDTYFVGNRTFQALPKWEAYNKAHEVAQITRPTMGLNRGPLLACNGIEHQLGEAYVAYQVC